MTRRRLSLLSLFFAAACSGADSTAPRSVAVPDQARADYHDGSFVPGSGGNAGNTPAAAKQEALACTVPAPLYGHAVIGAKGGTLDVGPHRLIIPPGALTQDVDVSGTVPAGNTLTIDFAPHGLRFKKPAGLILDASACAGAPNVLYIDEHGDVAQRIVAVFSNWWHTIAAALDHFSTYMVDV